MSPKLTPSSLLHFEKVPKGVKALLESARIYCEKGEWVLAEGCACDAQDTCKHEGDRLSLAVAQLHLVDIYREVGELGRAMRLCKEAHFILHGRAEVAQRHNEAVAGYSQGLLHEMLLFGDNMQAVNCYQKALELFGRAKKHWASCDDKSRFAICQNACWHIEDRIGKIVNSSAVSTSELRQSALSAESGSGSELNAHLLGRRVGAHLHPRDQTLSQGAGLCPAVSIRADEQMKPNTLNVLHWDCSNMPFAVDNGRRGYIIDDNRVSINGITYRLHAGTLPTAETSKEHYYFVLSVPEDGWAALDARVGDYVLIRQQWRVGGEQQVGVVWEPGSGWVGVDFKRGRDGKIRFYQRCVRTQVIGGDAILMPPDDPTGKLKGYIVALLKPVRKTWNFASVIGLRSGSTFVLNEEYKFRVGFPWQGSRGLPVESIQSPEASFMEIDITVHAAGMEVLPNWRQGTRLFRDKGSALLEFTLIPHEVGDKQIEIDFYHQQHWLAKIQFSVEVVDAKGREAAL